MKVILPGINKVFEIVEDKVNSLILENQDLLITVITNLINQLNGKDGEIVISENDRVLQISKYCELLYQFVPFDLNTKTLVSKLMAYIEKRSMSSDYYESTQEVMSNLEKYLYSISFDLAGDICFSKLTLSSIIKSVGVGFSEDYNNLAEKIIDYMELVKEYDCDKLFFTLNLRDYINDADMTLFLDTALSHNLKIFMIECKERKLLENESRYIVDYDLCEIC